MIIWKHIHRNANTHFVTPLVTGCSVPVLSLAKNEVAGGFRVPVIIYYIWQNKLSYNCLAHEFEDWKQTTTRMSLHQTKKRNSFWSVIIYPWGQFELNFHGGGACGSLLSQWERSRALDSDWDGHLWALSQASELWVHPLLNLFFFSFF